MILEELLAVYVPCQARAVGKCASDNVTAVALVVLLVGVLIVVGSGLIWFKWGRGPFPWVMKIAMWRRKSRGG